MTAWDESGTPVLSLSGELDLSSAEKVRAAIEAAIGSEQERVVFETSKLAFMDSSGIALLLWVARRVRIVELRNPSPVVRRLVELTGLGDTLRIVT